MYDWVEDVPCLAENTRLRGVRSESESDMTRFRIAFLPGTRSDDKQWS